MHAKLSFMIIIINACMQIHEFKTLIAYVLVHFKNLHYTYKCRNCELNPKLTSLDLLHYVLHISTFHVYIKHT